MKKSCDNLFKFSSFSLSERTFSYRQRNKRPQDDTRILLILLKVNSPLFNIFQRFYKDFTKKKKQKKQLEIIITFVTFTLILLDSYWTIFGIILGLSLLWILIFLYKTFIPFVFLFFFKISKYFLYNFLILWILN